MTSLGIIVPVFNEAANITTVYRRICETIVLRKDLAATIIFIDDHSEDSTPQKLRELCAADHRVRWIRLARNRGSHIAVCAGLEYCDADLVTMLPADLQDPPEIILPLLDKQSEGFDIVWCARESRHSDPFLSSLASRIFYFVVNKITDLDMPARGADVFLANRRVVAAFRQMPDRRPCVQAALHWIGFRQACILYIRQKRETGRSKWTLGRKILLGIDLLVAFSYLPMRVMSLVGVCSTLIAFVWGCIIGISRVAGYTHVIGYASIVVAILFLGGLQMMMIGVLGEYLWRTLEESRRRPRYFIESASFPISSNYVLGHHRYAPDISFPNP